MLKHAFRVVARGQHLVFDITESRAAFSIIWAKCGELFSSKRE
jgi:hypothetical protein